MTDKKSGVELIAEERNEQIKKHGFNKRHDKIHDSFELTEAAISYAHQATLAGRCIWQDRVPNNWPFEASSWKPRPQVPGNKCPMIENEDAIKMLTIAGALIAAEIDRLQNL